jgi:pyrroline-5-carboxylate reductase
MGSAILSGILNAATKLSPLSTEKLLISNFMACVQSDASARKLQSVFKNYLDHVKILADDNLKAFQAADVILLACKPYMAESILGADHVRDALKGKLLISVLAGTSNADLERYIYGDAILVETDKCCVMRAMPNMAAQIGESITIIAVSPSPPPEVYANITTWIFEQCGDVCQIADNLYNAGAVLAGATPAFLTVAFDGILDGAVAQGIKRDVAKQILAQSFIGAAKLLQGGEHPAVLREKISSPKGTTIQGLNTLEKHGVRSAFTDAFVQSTLHSKNAK